MLASLCILGTLPTAAALHHMKRAPLQWVNRRDDTRPLQVTNRCPEAIYPAIATQAGTAPAVQGFMLATGATMNLTVSADWQGRVWGRTNCSFNAQGTGPQNAGGNNGGGAACLTGDCNGIVDCRVTVCGRGDGRDDGG
jgi:beta-mannosidase